MDNSYLIASFTVAEFRAFKKALQVLRACGMQHDEACTMLVSNIMHKRSLAERKRFAA